jgi:hypothetical protein
MLVLNHPEGSHLQLYTISILLLMVSSVFVYKSGNHIGTISDYGNGVTVFLSQSVGNFEKFTISILGQGENILHPSRA